MRDSCDAVVVGAGHNGLVAANMLADAGWDVQVLEATGTPGGGARSGQVAAPGYLSDLCSSFFPLGAASPVLRSLDLDAYGLAWRHAPEVLVHVLPDDRVVRLHRDPARTAASVAEFAAADRARWLAAYEHWERIGPDLVAALFAPFPPVRPGVRLLRRLGVGDGLRLARWGVLPTTGLAEELFAGEGARLLLAGCALHTDLPPAAAGGGLFGWLLAMLGQEHGFPVAAGGAQRITDALVARLRARGGRIGYGERVDRVVVAGGRAVGVCTAGGGSWRARRAVVADLPAPTLYLDLVGPDRLPPGLVADLAHFRWDGATVKIDWALSEPVPWGNPAAAGAGTFHLGADLAGLNRFGAALALGEVPAEPFVIGGQMAVADPVRAPAGAEVVWGYTHLPHRSRWHPEEIATVAERVEAALERHAPGFGRRVVGRRVTGPAELAAENPAMVGGAIAGGTSALHQQLVFRPVPGLARADTPIDRLYLANCSAHPGPGVHGGPGANAARSALHRDRPLTGPLYHHLLTTTHRALYPPLPRRS